ncbi:MAG: (deoxy)nucleoside triphosphate pyrophosphohydrolase [Bacillota bacterium]|jgi:8-oxo-dGTP diphosphatase
MTKVTAALIEKNGKILIAQRNGKGSQPLKWEFPGGKINDGETPEECLKRELKEELNLDIYVGEQFCTIVFDYPTWTIELLVFLAEILGGVMRLNVHNDVRWVSPSEISGYDFCPADVELVKKIAVQGDLKKTK